MRSTKTSTREDTLHWERTSGAHAGVEAEYGPVRFRVYAWQRGSYLATAYNDETDERLLRVGNSAGEVRTLAAGKALCEEVFRRLQAEDLKNGISRS
jgi:hypothetical protein